MNESRKFFVPLPTTMNITTDYIAIARELIGLQQCLKADLPYHINLVDAIGADENANSRILAGILSYHDKAGNYDVLKVFAKHFFSDTNLAEMIENPVIVTEQAVRNDKRIDIYIHEPGKYAVILENKVMDAPEQPHQLANYIEGLNDFGFTNEQIFIGYLPRTNETLPSDNSWTNRKGASYRDEFQPRFCNISFRDDILPWLKNTTFPADDNAMLQQSIAVYTDYLEGQFGFRPNEHFIQMKTDEYIASKLDFTYNPADNLQKAMDAVAELEQLKKELTRLNLTAAHTILSQWLERAKSSFPLLSWEDRSQSSQFPSIGFPVAYSGFKRAFKVFLQIDTWHNSIYYGIYLAEPENMPFAEARDLLKSTLDGLDEFTYSTGAKMFFAYANVAEAYSKFAGLTRIIQQTFD